MLPGLGSDAVALRLAERIVQVLDRGGFTATYKYAVLVGLMDLCLEKTTSNGLPPSVVTTRELAEKVIELYWLHCEPYVDPNEPPHAGKLLYQSTAGAQKPALIIRAILAFRDRVDPRRERSLSLSRARLEDRHGHYEELVREVEWTLIHMPLPRLQNIGRERGSFLYEYGFDEHTTRGVVERYQLGKPGGAAFDNRLTFKPGVSESLVALNGVLRPLVYRAWTVMVAELNGLKESSLEAFLFGEKRISLEPVKAPLLDLQGERCFYCERRVLSGCEVDHFVPWARHADNGIDNLVAAHRDCNGKKSDFLAAAEHVERWRQRSSVRAADLAHIAREARWESRPARTLSVARALYGMLPEDARLWRLGKDFSVIEADRPRIVAALAA